MKPIRFQIKRAQNNLETAQALSQLATQTFIEAYQDKAPIDVLSTYARESLSVPCIQKELADERVILFTATLGETLVGYAKLTLNCAVDEVASQTSVSFERNYVLKEFQNQGLGGQLYQVKLDEAKKRGFTQGWLRVWDQNHRAVKFHERNGFKTVGTRDFVVDLGTQKYSDTDLVMVVEF